MLVDLIYLGCKTQCDERGTTDEQFGRLLGGEVIARAEDAFWSALLFFFRGDRKESLKTQLDLAKRAEAAAMSELTEERKQKLTEAVRAEVALFLDAQLEESATSGS